MIHHLLLVIQISILHPLLAFQIPPLQLIASQLKGNMHHSLTLTHTHYTIETDFFPELKGLANLHSERRGAQLVLSIFESVTESLEESISVRRISFASGLYSSMFVLEELSRCKTDFGIQWDRILHFSLPFVSMAVWRLFTSSFLFLNPHFLFLFHASGHMIPTRSSSLFARIVCFLRKPCY
jgi:hypothetical protein